MTAFLSVESVLVSKATKRNNTVRKYNSSCSDSGTSAYYRPIPAELDFPRVNVATYGRRAFAYAGPTSWNSLPDSLKDINLTLQTFKRHLKTFIFFLHTSTFSAFEVSYKNALYKSTVITQLLFTKQKMVV